MINAHISRDENTILIQDADDASTIAEFPADNLFDDGEPNEEALDAALDAAGWKRTGDIESGPDWGLFAAQVEMSA